MLCCGPEFAGDDIHARARPAAVPAHTAVHQHARCRHLGSQPLGLNGFGFVVCLVLQAGVELPFHLQLALRQQERFSSPTRQTSNLIQQVVFCDVPFLC